jgi:polyisoprenoid-binding protein YceI
MTTTLAPESPPASQSPRTARRRRQRIIAAFVAVLIVAGAGAGVWWFLRDDAPAAVDLQAATAEVDTGSAATATDASGTWLVDTSVGTFDYEDSTGTFVGFRVEEELSGVGSTTAVGRTPDVAGRITIEGTTLTAVTIEADMTSITTNDSRRDDNVQEALETSTYPTATFVLTEPIELGDAVTSGEAVTVDAVGELTIHGVTTTVTIPLEAQVVDGLVVVVGSLDVTFSDYGVTVPSAPILLSADDHGVVEFQLFFSEG